MTMILAGSTSVVRYFMMRLVSTGAAATGLTITTFDIQYTRELTASAASTAGLVGTGGATTWVVNKVFELDATNSPGLYMVCYADAAFASGVDQVTLNVTYDATVFSEAQNIQLTAFDPFDAVRAGLTALPNFAAGAAGGIADNTTALGNVGIDWANVENPTTALNLSGTNIDVDQIVASVSGNVDGSVATLTTLTAIPTDWLTAAGTAADFTTEIQAGLATPTNITAATGIVLSGVTHTGAVIPTVTTLTNLPAITTDWLTAAGTHADFTTEIQTGLATPTNITAATGVSLASTGLDAIAQSATGMVEIAKAVWDRVLSKANHDIAQSAGKRLRQIDQAFEVHSGTARVTSTSTTIDLETATADNATDEIYAGDRCVIVAGTGIGEHGLILSYNSTTQVATMSKAWVITPDATSEYILSPADCDVEMWNDNTVTGDGDWAIMQTDLDTITGAAGALIDDGTGAGQIALTAGAIDTVTTLTNLPTITTDWLTADGTAADFTTEVQSGYTAQTGDTYALLNSADSEPAQATPVHTASLAVKIATIFKFMVNKKTATATQINVFNSDEATVDVKSTISDDATTYTEGEYITGP